MLYTTAVLIVSSSRAGRILGEQDQHQPQGEFKMRRTLSVIAIAAATLLASPPLATAAPQQDRVTGKGTIEDSAELRANARSGPQGENPKGTFSLDFMTRGEKARQGKVSCMIVAGNIAVVGGLDHAGVETFLVIQDNGESGDGVNYVSGAQSVPEPGQEECAEALSFGSSQFLPITGDFTVVDS